MSAFFADKYHAYVIESHISQPSEVLIKLLKTLEDEWEVSVKGNPDFSTISYERMGVDEARSLVGQASLRSVSAKGPRIFAISASLITIEAQNALLKLLEEPAPNTHFFIITDSASRLLPTVKSRMRIISDFIIDSTIDSASGSISTAPTEDKSEKKSSSVSVTVFPTTKIFLAASMSERLVMVQAIIKALEKEKIEKSDIGRFIKEVEKNIYDQKPISAWTEDEQLAFTFIDRIADYGQDRSSSAKLLLEALALFAPKF